MLSQSAKNFIKLHRDSSEWKEILEELKSLKTKPYQPATKKDTNIPTPDVQERNWIFSSGRAKERDRLYTLLTIGEYHDNRE